MTDTSEHPTLRLVGGPTALITYGGLRLLTDPTFDPPARSGSGAAPSGCGPATRSSSSVQAAAAP